MKTQTENKGEYMTPKTKIVKVNVTNLICVSPGGNENPDDVDI